MEEYCQRLRREVQLHPKIIGQSIVPEDKGKWISPEKLSTHRIDDEAISLGLYFK